MKINDSKKITSFLYNKLTDLKWKSVLNFFINSNEFSSIIDELIDKNEYGERFTPPLRRILNPIISSPFDDLKVVLLRDEPFQNVSLNDGFAFGGSLLMEKSRLLYILHKKIVGSVYNYSKQEFKLNPDLRVWAEQGVLLLNAAFTTNIDTPKEHYELWRPFTNYIISMINSKHKNIVYLLIGDHSQSFADLIDEDNNLIIKIEELTYSKWDFKDCFNETNKYLKGHNKMEIDW